MTSVRFVGETTAESRLMVGSGLRGSMFGSLFKSDLELIFDWVVRFAGVDVGNPDQRLALILAIVDNVLVLQQYCSS